MLAEGEDEFDFAGLAGELLGDFARGFAGVGEGVDGLVGGVLGGGRGAAFMAEAGEGALAVGESGDGGGGRLGVAQSVGGGGGRRFWWSVLHGEGRWGRVGCAGVSPDRFEAADFFVGFDHELFEAGVAVVELRGDAAGGFFDVGEQGVDFHGDLADVEGVLWRAGGGGGGVRGGGAFASGDGVEAPAADGVDEGGTASEECELDGREPEDAVGQR